MTELTDLVLEEAGEKMEKAVAHAKHEFSTIRTGRASAALIEKLPVRRIHVLTCTLEHY